MGVVEPNQELALGLDLLKGPFLWVIHLCNDKKENNMYPDEFYESKGKIVGWTPRRRH